MKIIEENESMKGRLRNLDTVHAERDELLQQLEAAKHELFTEQKRARARLEELQEVRYTPKHDKIIAFVYYREIMSDIIMSHSKHTLASAWFKIEGNSMGLFYQWS